jgi:TusA-related sulfurtransferase
MDRPTPDKILDSSGTFCPVPIIETAKAIREMAPGEVLQVIATDPGVETDMPAWCKSTRNLYLGTDRDGAVFHSWVRKRAD